MSEIFFSRMADHPYEKLLMERNLFDNLEDLLLPTAFEPNFYSFQEVYQQHPHTVEFHFTKQKSCSNRLRRTLVSISSLGAFCHEI